MSPAKRLLLLDGHSLAYRAFYALPVENFATTTGEPTNAVYGFTSMLINLLRDEDPTHIAVAFDVSRRTFRTESFPEYKATRAKTPDEFRSQLPLIKQVLEAMKIPALEAEGFEADDIIATLTAQAHASKFETMICTGDRDSLQLVDATTTVLYPKKGVSDLARMTPAAVEAKYGLAPHQYPDLAALRGDPSDNLPGIPGVGEKTAAKWILQFGSFDALMENAANVPGKVGEALRAHIDDVKRNRELTELVRTVPLPLTVEDLKRQPIEAEDVHLIFDALQFRVLRERLAPMMTSTSPSKDVPQRVEIESESVAAGKLSEWLEDISIAGIALDRGHLAVCSHTSTVIDLSSLGVADKKAIATWLADPSRAKIFHDAKPAILTLLKDGLHVAGLVGDTCVAAYLVLPGQRSLELGALAERFLGRTIAIEESSDGETLDFAPTVNASNLLVRARATVDLHEHLVKLIKERGVFSLYVDVEIPLVLLLSRMEAAGIAIDRDGLAHLEAYFNGEAKAAADHAYQVVGHEFNLGSPKQLQVVLFDELKLPKTKKNKTGYTTDAEALQSLQESHPHPVLEDILRHRDVTKLRSTIEGLQRSIAADGRIHTTFQQTVAATGRLSSTDPNLQNIPVRTDEGRRIRECFVVGQGYDLLMTADYSQIEMRIMAHLSDDQGLLAAFATGEDLHTTVAAQVFGVAPDQVDSEMRRRIKAMSYGLAYGLSSYGLAQQLGISDADARSLMESYFMRFGGVRDYLRSVVELARGTGYTETLMGRRRYLPDLASDVRQRREIAERMALNAPIQGSAADIVKVAMLKVDSALIGMKSRVLLQVHDELVLEVVASEQRDVEEIVRREMGAAYPLNAPLEVSVGFGRSWHEAAH